MKVKQVFKMERTMMNEEYFSKNSGFCYEEQPVGLPFCLQDGRKARVFVTKINFYDNNRKLCSRLELCNPIYAGQRGK